MMCQDLDSRPQYILQGLPQSFDVCRAYLYGLLPSVVYSQLKESLEDSHPDDLDIDESGIPWLKDAPRQMQRSMPYATVDQIRDCLGTLARAGLIIFKPEGSSRPQFALYSLPKDQWRAT
jgi:hypothetical protein